MPPQKTPRTKQQQCVYCPRPATTRDHLPPESLFTPPLPSDRIAVPACYRCNNDASKDDGVFRDELSIMAGSFGGSANAAERLQVTLRGLRRKEATARCARMLKSAQLVERRTPSGLFLGYGYAMPVAPGVQQRVIAR